MQVIDWRTPIASLYYDERLGKVSYESPSGEIKGNLSLKRVYDIEKGKLQSFSDVDITTNDELLKPYLSDSSDNRLKNIISTIQMEQNKIIRAKLNKTIIVQGVAGSGKTTVALHRIAYLAYAYEKELKPFENIKKIEYKKQSEFEKSIVVLPNADIILTQKGKDHYFGNALKQDVINFDEINSSSKIRTLVAHNEEGIRNKIIDSIEKLPYVKIVGTAKDGNETYQKILDLKPEMVFVEYNLNNMNGLEIMKKSKEELHNEMPMFNFIIENNTDNTENFIHDAMKIGNLNAVVREPYKNSFADILSEYKEYKTSK